MGILFSGILGAILNRIRGGWFDVPFNKNLNDLFFGLWMWSLSDDIVFGLLMFGAMWLGRAPGWGVYVAGIIQENLDPQANEINVIDNLVLGNRDMPVLRSTLALSLRGVMWTVPLALCLIYLDGSILSFLLLGLSGLLMGPVYLAAVTLTEKFSGSRDGWGESELPWGAVLWSVASVVVYANV